jgi:hypothetical protein
VAGAEAPDGKIEVGGAEDRVSDGYSAARWHAEGHPCTAPEWSTHALLSDTEAPRVVLR